MMESIKKFFTSTVVKRWLWTAFDGLLGALIVYFTEINIGWIIPIFATIQGITKEIINKRTRKVEFDN